MDAEYAEEKSAEESRFWRESFMAYAIIVVVVVVGWEWK